VDDAVTSDAFGDLSLAKTPESFWSHTAFQYGKPVALSTLKKTNAKLTLVVNCASA